MIKRPALALLVAFFCGILSCKYRNLLPIVLVLFFFLFFFSYVLLPIFKSGRFPEKLKKYNIKFLQSFCFKDIGFASVFQVRVLTLIMLVFFLVGVLRCFIYSEMTDGERKPYVLLKEQKESSAIVSGEVKDIVYDDSQYKIVLGNCIIKGYVHEKEMKAGGCCVYVDARIMEETGLEIGNEIKVYGKFSLYEEATNPGQFDAYKYNLRYRLYASIFAKSVKVTSDKIYPVRLLFYKLRVKMRTALYNCYDADVAAVLYAMTTGDKTLLSEEVKNNYRLAGIGHILAISGLHVTLLCMGIFRWLRKLKFPVKLNYSISILLLLFFCIYTGWATSAIRATIMNIFMLVSYWSRKKYDLLSALFSSAIFTLFLYPFEFESAGFLLSYTAMIGVYMAMELEAEILGGAIITAMTLPFSLWFYYEFATYGVIANLFVIHLSAIVLLAGMISGVMGALWQPLGYITAMIADMGLKATDFLTEKINILPYSYLLTGKPELWSVVLYYMAVVVCFILACRWKKESDEKKSSKSLIFGMVMYGVMFFILINPGTKDSMAFLDVGQGDSCVLLNGGNAVLFDCGSSSESKVGKYRLSPYLKYNGVAVIDVATLSHLDEDHYSGIKEILESMPFFYSYQDYIRNYDGNIGICRLVLPKVKEKDEMYLELENLAKSKGVKLLYIEKGEEIRLPENTQDVEIQCLWPDSAVRSENDTSLVFRVNLPRIIVFLQGDAGVEAERKIIESINDKFSKDIIIKVGHHGSKTSTSKEYLEQLKPDVAVISCGYNNTYGHPHKNVLEVLESYKVKIWRTDISGALIVK